MKPLPMPIRIAAGLVATALEEVQELPRKLTEMPVTAVSGALQASMRLQQRITELAIKGDRALGALRPVPETPAWARFDEDEDLAPRNGLANGLRSVEMPRPPKVTPVRILPDPEPEDFFDEDDFPEPGISELPVPRPPVEHPDSELPAAEVVSEPNTAAATSTKTKTPGTKTSGTKTPGTKKSEPKTPEPTAKPAETGPPGLPEYESWTLPQLRGRFRALSLEQLERLLAWETTHQDRPPFVTMLSNRITSVAGR
ncbi:lipid droplet-associated protein [Pseudonocardia sp. Cha107L01]|uniref:lipid droplet-associated protein n=1 Tax=Pseudonocardia sp. Cha107L01 TaxID=3457576 RepID=UPI00403EDAC9